MATPTEKILAEQARFAARTAMIRGAEPCAQCGVPLSGTYWHLQGRHYCEACGDGLVWTRLPSGAFAWLRPEA